QLRLQVAVDQLEGIQVLGHQLRVLDLDAEGLLEKEDQLQESRGIHDALSQERRVVGETRVVSEQEGVDDEGTDELLAFHHFRTALPRVHGVLRRVEQDQGTSGTSR